MPVTSVTTDPEALTLTLVADFPVAPERVWKAFTDPQQLQRFWGPPGYPSTFTSFDFTPGGVAQYSMTSPRGDASYGRWEFTKIDPGTSFEVLDAFADADGVPTPDMPATRMSFTVSATADGAQLHSVTYFPSAEALEQMVGMGMVEGATMSMGQLDVVLQSLRDYAQGKGTRTEILDDQHVRITRLIDGPAELVWRAHHDRDLMTQWLLGPDGWTMPVCDIAQNVGDSYRYEWVPAEGTEGHPFGFVGELVHAEPGRRSVTTERLIGVDGIETLNDLNLYEEDGATLLTLYIEYPDAATRDMILATGMTEGMETSYARLESLVTV